MKKLRQNYSELLAEDLNLKINPDAHVFELGCQDGLLLSLLHCQSRTGTETERDRWKPISDKVKITPEDNMGEFPNPDVVLISNTLNRCADAEIILRKAFEISQPKTRLIICAYNTLWRPIINIGKKWGLCEKNPQENWLSGKDIQNLAELAGWEIIRQEGKNLIPLQIIFSSWINKFLGPLLPGLCLSLIITCRKKTTRTAHKLSIVIPTRNEAGTVQEALDRMPVFTTAETEVIFVEGNSKDDTWDKIQALPSNYNGMKIIKTQQGGKGKGDAVRKGFSLASGDILIILDGDLTMPPEELGKFVQALESGTAEFANGCRLVYNMDKKAMQLANLIANKCFGIGFSWLLGQPLKDTLCGTKVLWKEDYLKIQENRAFFGDFDPFGDFDLLFGAAKQNLKIRDIPIHYKERSYGTTNIQRWHHGVILLRMMLFAARKLKFT